VAVSLLKARINFDASSQDYLTQILDDVYNDTDDRNYQLSSYSYFILPTKVQGQFNTDKGKTLGAFTYYAMCQAQQQSASLGYSPLPVNLVKASLDQIKKIPGVVVENIDISKCNNPTFSPDGTNVLAANAPHPQPCDKQGPLQCATGTGGAKKATAVKPGAAGGAAAAAAARKGAAGAGGGAGSAGGAGGAGANALANGATDASGALANGAVDDTGGGGGTAAAASPTVLAGSSGWAAAQSLMVLVVLLTLGLVLGPPLWWRWVAARRDQPTRGGP
jgi:hypothetical protein